MMGPHARTQARARGYLRLCKATTYESFRYKYLNETRVQIHATHTKQAPSRLLTPLPLPPLAAATPHPPRRARARLTTDGARSIYRVSPKQRRSKPTRPLPAAAINGENGVIC